MTESPPALKRPRRGKTTWLDIGVAAAALPIAVAGFRILLYSGGDPVLMRVLIETLDVQALILGTLLPLLPALVWIAYQPFVFDTYRVRQFLGDTRQGRIRSGVLGGLLLTLYALLGSWPQAATTVGYLLGGSALAIAVAHVVTVIGARRSGKSWLRALTTRGARSVAISLLPSRYLIVVPALIVALVLIIPGSMWLPLEKIQVGDDQIEAYVLQNEGEWMTMLEQDNRIRRVESELVTERLVCDQGEYLSLLLIWTGRADTDPPACD